MEIKFEYSEAIELSGGYEDGYKDGYATGAQDATPTLQEKAVTPGKEPLEVSPDEGFDALSNVIVAGDEELVPENLIEGAEVFGVAGIDKGYATGYAEGEDAGQSAGYASGRADGYSEGHADGEAEGREAGYAEGYSKGAQDAAPTLQAKSIKPGAEAKTVLPDEGFDALSSVEVEGDENLTAENIVEGVSIFDIEGSFKAPDVSDLDWLISGIDVPSELKNERVTVVKQYFAYGVKELESIDLPNVTLVNQNAFDAISVLTSKGALANANLPNCTRIGSTAFRGQVLDGVLDFKKIKDVGNYAFQKCGIVNLDIPEATSLGSAAFSECESLKTANVPAATSVGGSAFADCASLEEINLPSATTINASAFTACTALKKADLGAMTRLSSSNVFNGCSALEALVLRSATLCSLSNTNVFTGTPIAAGTGYIYVPSALLDSYKAATNWSTFADQFRAIEDYPDIVGGAV